MSGFRSKVAMAQNIDALMDKELITDELTFGSLTFYTVDPVGYDWDQIYDWAVETLGPPRTDKGGHDRKWFVSAGVIHFHEQKYRDWLILRWGGQ